MTVSLLVLIEVPRVLLPRVLSRGRFDLLPPQTIEMASTKQKQKSAPVVNTLFYFLSQRKTERERDDPHSSLDGQSPQHANVCSWNPVHCSQQGRYSRVATQKFTSSTKTWEIIICSKWSGKSLQRGKNRFIERQDVSWRFKDSTSSSNGTSCSTAIILTMMRSLWSQQETWTSGFSGGFALITRF